MGQTVLVRLIESQIWHLPASSVALLWEKVQKRVNGLCPPFCVGESCPPALALMPDTSVPFRMPLVPFKLLHQCWSSEGVILSKSVRGFFKRNRLELLKFLLLTQSPLVFAARSFGDLSSCPWNPGQGGLVWGWDALLLRYPSKIFIHYTWVWDQPIHVSSPPTSLDGCGFFNSVVVRLPFNSIF